MAKKKRTPQVLRFDELIPEPDNFEDAEGGLHPFKSRAEFDSEDMEFFVTLEGQYDALLAQYKVAQVAERKREKENAAALEADADAVIEIDDGTLRKASMETTKKLEALMDEVISFILPGMTDEQVKALKMGQQIAMMEWWGKQNKVKN